LARGSTSPEGDLLNGIHSAAELLLPRRLVTRRLHGILAAPSSESCGLITGHASEKRLRVHDLVPCENLSGLDTEFIISPRDFLRVARSTQSPMRVVGIYHSHFGSARPSEADKRGIRLHDFVWLIVGNAKLRRVDELEYSAYMCGSRQGVISVPIRWR
jgi:proteasome lid subunit RPN8/RPN11